MKTSPLLYALCAGVAMFVRQKYPDYQSVIDVVLVTLGIHRLEDTRETVRNGGVSGTGTNGNGS